MTFDGSTKDPIQQAVRHALIAFMAAIAKAQAMATKEAQRAGIAAAKSDPRAYRGRRPSYTRAQFNKVVIMLNAGEGASAISAQTGLTRQTILRIRHHRANSEEALALWDL